MKNGGKRRDRALCVHLLIPVPRRAGGKRGGRGQGMAGGEPMLLLRQGPVCGRKGPDRERRIRGKTVSKTPSENVSKVFCG